MEKELAEQLTKEANKIIEERADFMYEGYLKVRKSYKKKYRLIELDSLRHEICICICFGLYQAAITLTNHLLESLLKSALIFYHGRSNFQTKDTHDGKIVSSLVNQYREAIEKYGDANLINNINSASKLGLISKEDKKELHKIRVQIRNAYGHADKVKMFGEMTIPVSGIKIENNTIKTDEECNPLVAKFPIGQGIIQSLQAKNLAPNYFLYIDSLVRKLNKSLFKSR
jgi:hypothetical protein